MARGVAQASQRANRDAVPSQTTFEEAVRNAKARFKSAGIRWTSTRERALQLLLTAGAPVKAYDLLAGFNADGPATPPTVYRSLDALVEMSLAHRIPSLNAYVACQHQGSGRHTAMLLICELCRKVDEIVAPTQTILQTVRANSGFRAAAVVLEVHGCCELCQRAGRE